MKETRLIRTTDFGRIVASADPHIEKNADTNIEDAANTFRVAMREAVQAKDPHARHVLSELRREIAEAVRWL